MRLPQFLLPVLFIASGAAAQDPVELRIMT